MVHCDIKWYIYHWCKLVTMYLNSGEWYRSLSGLSFSAQVPGKTSYYLPKSGKPRQSLHPKATRGTKNSKINIKYTYLFFIYYSCMKSQTLAFLIFIYSLNLTPGLLWNFTLILEWDRIKKASNGASACPGVQEPWDPLWIQTHNSSVIGITTWVESTTWIACKVVPN